MKLSCPFGSLKCRLVLLMLLVALPGFLAVFIHVHQQRESAINFSRNQAQFVVQHSLQHQHHLVESTRQYLELLANYPLVKKPSDPACSEYLSHLLRFNNDFVNLGVPNKNGQLLCNALPLDKPVSVADRGYFQRALEHRSFAIGEYQLDRAADIVSINFAYPVIADDGHVAGAVVAVVSLNWWNQYLAESGLPDNAVAYIYDASGEVIARYPSDSRQSGGLAERHDQRFEVSDSSSSSAGEQVTASFIHKGLDDIHRVYFTADLYKTPAGRTISMSVGVPIEAEISAANRQLYVSLLLLIGLMVGVLIIAINGLRVSILRPLAQLTEATRLLSEGRFTLASVPQAAPEIIQLHAQFQDMAGKRLDAEQQVLEKNEVLNSVFNALPDLYFRLNEDGIILDYKADVESDLYLSPDAFLNRSIIDVMPASVGFNEYKHQLKNRNGSVIWEYRLDFSGDEKYFEARMSRIAGFNQFIVVVRNITAKKHAEESLELSATVFKSMSESILVTDANGVILDANPAFTKITGYRLDDVIGQTPAILKSGYHDAAFYASFWQQLTDTGTWEGEIYNQRKNGEVFPEWLTINTVYDNENTPVRRIAMFIDFTEKKRAEEVIWHQAHKDTLTGLPNRKLLSDRILQELEHTDRSGLPTAVLFLDLDLFKEINDTLGHVMGDQLLVQVADRLIKCVRSMDTVARQGGDEFTILLSQVKNMHVVDTICDELLHQLALPFQLGEETAYITASIGITFYPDDATNADDLIKSADQAMYAAKQSGRNRYQYFTQQMQQQAIDRRQLISDLRQGISEHQFVLYYQPIVQMSDRSVQKAEALLRWPHPEKGMIMPDDFIPVAEETRLIISIGRWVLEEASKAVLMLRDRYHPAFQVSVNISPVQFESLDSNISSWLEQLGAMALSGDSIVAEITEGMMMSDAAEIREKMIAFEAAGVQVALDDFGTGYSSLAYISEYDIDYLKIDRYFVKNLSLSSDAYTLCKAIIVMAHNLGIKVIAEGIETEQQHRLLLELGCDLGQGYLYSKPLTLGDFEQLLYDQLTANE
ncbi:EAL domain-containing protein [Amphritea sp. 1_MG-2023]|uniref:bifunctional diguanylate cyclase/phosphodiesterase n=1 Tax=Amphritea sp. 1_MG-2023 TaxID=3062670 RepID=UPI0026E15F14|nr:EAL domain-containing protein [Amphritea sp. 1_MG-2023]MDO6561774.1 EAL domain-containing protein [Amphritea sp. 1_MG-2023]